MPVLHKHKDSNSYYVLTSIKGQIVTFQLTAEGYTHLQEAGIVPGKPFNRFLLLDIYRMGYAFTGHTGVEIIPGQGVIDFPDDPEPETMFPSCSACMSQDDLHLVEMVGHKHSATILCGVCRAKELSRIDTSIPLPFVTRGVLSRIFTMKDLQKKDVSVLAFQELLDQDFSKRWEGLRRRKPVQESLMTGVDPQDSLL
jgi:hypothetical protein